MVTLLAASCSCIGLLSEFVLSFPSVTYRNQTWHQRCNKLTFYYIFLGPWICFASRSHVEAGNSFDRTFRARQTHGEWHLQDTLRYSKSTLPGEAAHPTRGGFWNTPVKVRVDTCQLLIYKFKHQQKLKERKNLCVSGAFGRFARRRQVVKTNKNPEYSTNLPFTFWGCASTCSCSRCAKLFPIMRSIWAHIAWLWMLCYVHMAYVHVAIQTLLVQ